MNFKKYNRFFAFGCSFTQYMWPTWADIISKEVPDTYLYAKSGAGNFYIYQAVIEAILTHTIDKNDLVMIMFSNVTREDRYTKKNGWMTPGNLFFQDTYDKKFMEKFFCEKGYLMRDLALIEGITRSLKETGVDYKLMSMVPFNSLSSDSQMMEGVDDVLDLYSSTIDRVMPSVFDVIFNGNWNSRPNRPEYRAHWHWNKGIYVDNHPTTEEHLEYLLKSFPTIEFSEGTLEFVRTVTRQTLDCKDFSEFDKVFSGIRLHPALRL
jgi:hypothetical protein